MTGRLAGKVAFITGAARGQGRAHAVRMAKEGADVIAVDIAGKLPSCVPYPPATEEDLAETVRLVEETNRRILASVVDTRDFEGLRRVVDDGAPHWDAWTSSSPTRVSPLRRYGMTSRPNPFAMCWTST
jgi:NAD(P)-dependent dehydrogenase (short-subunit alcohol dehydrogenase family)